MRTKLVAFASLAFFMIAARAHAEPTAQERALADTLFKDAKKLVAAGNVGEACPKFAASQKLDPQVGTLLYLATCHQQEGKTASAWVEYNDAAAAAHTANQTERETLAHTRASALEPKLARVTIAAPKMIDALDVTVDGIAVPSSAWGTSFPVDPGGHVIEASAPHCVSWRRSVTSEEGKSLTIGIPSLVHIEAPPPPLPRVVEPPSSHVEAPPPASDGRRSIGFVSIGVGAAGIITGSIFGVLAINGKNDAVAARANGGCVGSLCTQPVLDKESNARTMGWISTAGFGVGILGAGIGTWLLLTSHAKEPSKTVYFAPAIGPHDVGLTGGASF